MSHFLRNIITRHQLGAANESASYIVQPRPKSRFEADSGAGLSQTRHDQELEPITTTASRQPLQRPQIPPHHPTNTNIDNTTSGPHTDDVNEFIDASNLPTDRIEPAREQTDPNKTPEQSNQQNPSMHGELNPRIQTILRRLNSQKPQRIDNQNTSAEPREDLAFSKAVNNALKGSVELPLAPEPILKSEKDGSMNKQSIEHQPELREFHHTGLLQTPNWLTELQSNLNNRWRDADTQVDPEPVVNVTIGRVEVRAVQSDSVKQAKTLTKPSGIMSLDDYLKRRNREQA